ncbi:CLUMA_CG010303, isoform A [Clunio marinus]|uniref:Arginase n=1 Tax=Clunio marinus TaxID=568069 RepID=A0A1J1IEW7_9DIPT|nr:CLUMA_CG010303, isoform A [Clunio marinus]
MWALKTSQNFSKLSSSAFLRSLHSETTAKGIGIIGVPFDKGAGKVGTNEGPNALRDAGLIDEIRDISVNIDVKDYGDVHYELTKSSGRRINNLRNLEHVAACNKALAEKIEEITNDNRMPIALGGDHSIAVGSITGLRRKMKSDDLCVLWVDAHIDLNTSSSSLTGNMHGMPVSLLVKELRKEWPTIPILEWCQAQMSLKNFCWIGLRSTDYYEKLMMEKYGINYFDMRDIERMGIEKVVQRALEKINLDGKKKLHVSFDIDALDPLYANSTGTPVMGGLTLREGVFLMEQAYNTGTLSSLDLVEVNPLLGNERDVENTVNAAKLIIQAACGSNRTGNL